MLTDAVKTILKANMWDLATCADGIPNVVPVAFKDVTDDGKLVVGDVFLQTTLDNIHKTEAELLFRLMMPKNWKDIRLKVQPFM